MFRQATRAKALDAVRGILPAASLSNVGIYGSGQAFEALLLRLRAHPLPEARDYGELMLHELRKVIPSFLRRVDVAERGGRWTHYLATTRQRTAELVDSLFADRAVERRADGDARRLRPRCRGQAAGGDLLPALATCPSTSCSTGSPGSVPPSGWRSCGPTSASGRTGGTIANPVFFGMIRGAERAAHAGGFTMLMVETQESEPIERDAVDRLLPLVDGVILSASRMGDQAIRNVAKRTPVVLLNRTVAEVSSVISDNVHAIKKATEHLVGLGHTSICYLAGPEASWGGRDALAGLARSRSGPGPPGAEAGSLLTDDPRRMAQAAEQWAARPSTGVIAYNDLMAIGFMQGVIASGRSGAEGR